MINYTITESTDHLVVGRFDFDTTKNIVAEVLDTIDPELLHPPEIGGHDDSLEDNDVRKGTITWLDNCDDTSNLLRQLIDEVNLPRWNYFLDDDNPSIQFTMYADEGDHYDWHKDQYEEHDDYIRKVSISVCLSHVDICRAPAGALQISV